MSAEMAQEFSDRSACADELKRRLHLLPETSAIDRELLKLLTDACNESGADSDAQDSDDVVFETRVGRWVIRDDDLKLLEAVRDATLAFAAASYVVQDLAASEITAIAFAFLELARNARQAGGWLTSPQLQIVRALEKSGRTASRNDLLKKLPKGWTEADIDREVKGLHALPTRGGPTKVVDELTDGQIILCGI